MDIVIKTNLIWSNLWTNLSLVQSYVLSVKSTFLYLKH